MFSFIKRLFGQVDILSEGRSPHWETVRKQHLVAETTCQCCGTNKKLQVHHCKPFHLHPEEELDDKNLITLCERCHLFVGHLDDWHSFNKDVRKDAAYFLDKIQKRP